VQTCAVDGTWGDCEGSVGPGNEMCNAVDDDCDGEVDEAGGGDDVGNGGLCAVDEECVAGECTPLEPVDPPGEDDGEGGYGAGCGCSGGTGGGSGALMIGLAVVAMLRRRRP
jgi:MYXO-CTERM domain-containing protein